MVPDSWVVVERVERRAAEASARTDVGSHFISSLACATSLDAGALRMRSDLDIVVVTLQRGSSTSQLIVIDSFANAVA